MEKHEHKKHSHSDHCCGHDKATESANEKMKYDNVNVENVKTSTFYVSGMDCADEISAIQKTLRHPMVASVKAELMSSKVIVEHDQKMDNNELVKLINAAGVKVKKDKNSNFIEDNRARVRIIIVSGILLVTALVGDWFFDFPRMALLTFYLISTLIAGSLVFPKALRAIKGLTLDMNVLMTMAAVGAFAIGEYSEAATVVFLFSLAEMLEAFSVARARKAVQELLAITPDKVLVKDNQGEFVEKLVEEVSAGSEVMIRAGDRIALDCQVIDGHSSVNQAALTGESIPVEKGIGDVVYAGTVNGNGILKAKSLKTFEDTKLSQIIKLIEEAQGAKAPAQKFVDRFARIYTPIVTVVAILVCIIPPLLFGGVWGDWLYRSLVFLVIACPCALVIATPVSIVSGLTSLARKGVLIKGGAHLEDLAQLKALALDKTGTITEGRPKVVSEKIFKTGGIHNFLDIALSVESLSSHPLAQAVATFSEEKNAKKYIVEGFKVIAGQGIIGRIEGHPYFVGNHKMAHSLGACSNEIEQYLQGLEDNAESVVIIGHIAHDECSAEVIGVLGLIDNPKENTAQYIQDLYKAGLEEVVILSGDNQKTVNVVAQRIGIQNAYGDLLPEHKVEKIKELLSKHGKVGMIGDGINDAPALAHATIGISMGAMGSDAAIETSDVALMNDDLGQVAKAVLHGKKCLNIIRFNIGFALAIKAVFLVLGVMGYSNLWLAVAADMGASLLVIANSLRLLRI